MANSAGSSPRANRPVLPGLNASLRAMAALRVYTASCTMEANRLAVISGRSNRSVSSMPPELIWREASIKGKDVEAVPLAAQCLRITAFVQPIQAGAWIFAGALRGAGDTKWPFYITLICNWALRTLGAVLCISILHLGLPAAVLCTCLDNTGRCIMTYLRFQSGKWQTSIKDKNTKTSAA